MATTHPNGQVFSRRQKNPVADNEAKTSGAQNEELQTEAHTEESHTSPTDDSEAIVDPVCGARVKNTTRHSVNYQDKTFYFCCPGCKTKFLNYPERYIPGYDNDETITAEAPYASYRCLVHSAVTQSHPGDCPVCGAVLKFELPVADELALRLNDFKRRFIWSLPFTFNLVLIGVFGESLQWFPSNTLGWIELFLALPVISWAGQPIFKNALKSLTDRHPNMWTLIGLGLSASIGYSAFALLARAFSVESPALNYWSTYFETSVILVSLTLLGQIFEMQARSDTGSIVKSLIALRPNIAHRVNMFGETEDISIENIKVGDLLQILPGEKIPADGVVVKGHSAVDESMLNGGVLPASKFVGDRLIGATINITSEITLRAQRVGKGTLLAQIFTMVNRAQLSRAPIQQMADSVAGKFSAAVIAIAILTFFIWTIYGPGAGLFFGLNCAVATLIIACPCALGLATPMSIMVSMSESANLGILYRDAEAIEKLCRVDTLIFDKTGTLTVGKPSLFRVVSCCDNSENDIVSLAASVNQMSEHPFACAILNSAREKKLPLQDVTDFEVLPGLGVQGKIQDKLVAIGGNLLLEKFGLNAARLAEEANIIQEQGASRVYVIIDNQLAGMFALADPIKKTSLAAVEKLRAQHIRLILASGDSINPVKYVANALGITEFYADLNPADKLALVQRLQAEENLVAMAGGGINDAPALAQADVGIAMGTGTDVAINSGNLVIVKGDLRKIADARAISQKTVVNMKKNLAFAFIYNLIAVPVAAGLLYPFTGWILSPIMAALVMTMSSASVVLSALALGTSIRLIKINPENS